MSRRPPADLIQAWVHSHEEDSAGREVYRPEAFAFPPARGRRGFELNPDGTLTEFGPGPSDRPTSTLGRWETDQEGRLVFHETAAEKPARVMKIASLTPDKLVLEKETE